MDIVKIHARDIPDAWFMCVSQLQEHGYIYPVQQGSFVGETRKEFDLIVVEIADPYAHPYDKMIPEIPHGLGIPNPVEYGYIEEYMPYWMTTEIGENETYTYGSRLWPQVPGIMKLLMETPNTNQAILQVAHTGDTGREDPPCLRHIDCKVRDNKLIFYAYFRSWDLWNGFPANLAAIAILQEYMSVYMGMEMGELVGISKSLHTYGYVEEIAKVRVNWDEKREAEGEFIA